MNSFNLAFNLTFLGLLMLVGSSPINARPTNQIRPFDIGSLCNWNERELNCANLTNLSELFYSEINETVSDEFEARVFEKFTIRPINPILFDINLILLHQIQFKEEYELNLNNFYGFELNASSFQDNETNSRAYLTIANSSFTFYMNNVSIDNDDGSCKRDMSNVSLLTLFDSIETLTEVIYTKHMCPYSFANVQLEYLRLNGIDNAKNSFGFIDLDAPVRLNSTIQKLEITNSKFYLDSRLLDPLVFESVAEIEITGSELMEIESQLFANGRFARLSRLSLSLTNFYSFIAFTDLEWWTHLNGDVSVDLNNQLEINAHLNRLIYLEMSDELAAYDYPNEDFCLFKHFPHSRLVFPVLKSDKSLKCSCTIIWLIKNWSKFGIQNDLYYTKATAHCFEPLMLNSQSFEDLVYDCHFDTKLQHCESELTSLTSSSSSSSSKSSINTELSTDLSTTTTTTASSDSQLINSHRDDASSIIYNLKVTVWILGVALTLTLISLVVFLFRFKLKQRILRLRMKNDEISFATFVAALKSKDYQFIDE